MFALIRSLCFAHGTMVPLFTFFFINDSLDATFGSAWLGCDWMGDNFTSALHFSNVVVIVVPAMHEDRRSCYVRDWNLAHFFL